MTRRTGWTDEQFDIVLAYALRTGVTLAALVVLCGGFVFVLRHSLERPSYHVFHGEPGDFTSIRGIVADARLFSGRGLVQLGLLILVATPIVRVVLSVIGFVLQRDWLYVAITTIVLALLAYSLLGG